MNVNFFYLSVICVFNQIISLKLLFYEIVVDFRWKQNKKKIVINGVFFYYFFKQNYSFLIIYQIAVDFFEKRKKMKKSV